MTRHRDRVTPEGIEPCCAISGPRCMCLPYDDALVITSLILSIASVLISWVWWVSFIISVASLVLSQLTWCLRQPGSALYVFVAVSLVSFLAQIGVGIYALVRWKNSRYCYIFVIDDYTYDYYDDYLGSSSRKDHCPEEVWATISFLSGALSAASSGFMFYFVKSGRHAKWEGNHCKNAETATATAVVDVELAPTTTTTTPSTPTTTTTTAHAAALQGLTTPESEPPQPVVEPNSSSAGGEPAFATGVILVDKVDCTND